MHTRKGNSVSDYESQTLSDLPLFRATDPATSKRGARHASKKIGKSQAAMLSEFKTRPSTANEAAARCVAKLGGMPETYRKRAGELAHARLVRVTGATVCEVTKRVAQVYEVVK